MKRLATLILVILIMSSSGYSVMAYSDIDPWFEKDFNQAENEWRILPESYGYSDLNGTITRGEFSEIIIMSYRALGNELPESLETPVFSDVSNYYIDTAYQLGIVSGYDDGTFRENNPISRQEIFKMLSNFMQLVDSSSVIEDEQASRILEDFKDSQNISSWAKNATALVKYKGIIQGSEKGLIDPLSNTTRIQGVVLANRVINKLNEEKIVYSEQSKSRKSNKKGNKDNDENNNDAYKEDSNEYSVDYSYQEQNTVDSIYRTGYNYDKKTLVFGDTGEYQSAAEAEIHMVNVTIDVWTIDTHGNKYPATRTVKVNKGIAPMIELVFAEIFQGEEKFPIKSVSGYAWRANSTSEHRLGLAIDINPNENFMIRSDGTVVAGSYWKPGENPYSILLNGDVVQAFKKYGFDWGGTAWRSANDYMHFSYFGN